MMDHRVGHRASPNHPALLKKVLLSICSSSMRSFISDEIFAPFLRWR